MKVILCSCFKIQSSLFIALFLIHSNVWAVEMEIPLKYDLAWLKTVQVIALEGITLSTSDKDSGIIQGSKSFDKDSKYFTCPNLRGRAKSYSFNISATVREKTESSSKVSVQVEGLRKSYQNRHFLFITIGRVHSETKCESTGEIETSIFNRISQP